MNIRSHMRETPISVGSDVPILPTLQTRSSRLGASVTVTTAPSADITESDFSVATCEDEFKSPRPISGKVTGREKFSLEDLEKEYIKKRNESQDTISDKATNLSLPYTKEKQILEANSCASASTVDSDLALAAVAEKRRSKLIHSFIDNDDTETQSSTPQSFTSQENQMMCDVNGAHELDAVSNDVRKPSLSSNKRHVSLSETVATSPYVKVDPSPDLQSELSPFDSDSDESYCSNESTSTDDSDLALDAVVNRRNSKIISSTAQNDTMKSRTATPRLLPSRENQYQLTNIVDDVVEVHKHVRKLSVSSPKHITHSIFTSPTLPLEPSPEHHDSITPFDSVSNPPDVRRPVTPYEQPISQPPTHGYSNMVPMMPMHPQMQMPMMNQPMFMPQMVPMQMPMQVPMGYPSMPMQYMPMPIQQVPLIQQVHGNYSYQHQQMPVQQPERRTLIDQVREVKDKSKKKKTGNVGMSAGIGHGPQLFQPMMMQQGVHPMMAPPGAMLMPQMHPSYGITPMETRTSMRNSHSHQKRPDLDDDEPLA